MKFNLDEFLIELPQKNIEGNLQYFTETKHPIQFGVHEPKEDRWSRIHFHKFYCEFFYVERGEIIVEFTDSFFGSRERRTYKQGDAFIMMPGVGHAVFFPKGCRVIEVHQGPFVEDKVFDV